MITFINDDYNAWLEKVNAGLKAKNSNIQIHSLSEFFGNISAIAKVDGKFLRLPTSEEFFTIDANKRTITIPACFKNKAIPAVSGDNFAEILYFKINRYFDYVDLATKNIEIKWKLKASASAKDSIREGCSVGIFVDLDEDPDSIIFGWPLSQDMTSQSGVLQFSVSFYSLGTAEVKTYQFNTLSQNINISAGLIVNAVERVDYSDSIREYLVDSAYTPDSIGKNVADPKWDANSFWNDIKVYRYDDYNYNPAEPKTVEYIRVNLNEDGIFEAKAQAASETPDTKVEYKWSATPLYADDFINIDPVEDDEDNSSTLTISKPGIYSCKAQAACEIITNQSGTPDDGERYEDVYQKGKYYIKDGEEYYLDTDAFDSEKTYYVFSLKEVKTPEGKVKMEPTYTEIKLTDNANAVSYRVKATSKQIDGANFIVPIALKPVIDVDEIKYSGALATDMEDYEFENADDMVYISDPITVTIPNPEVKADKIKAMIDGKEVEVDAQNSVTEDDEGEFSFIWNDDVNYDSVDGLDKQYETNLSSDLEAIYKALSDDMARPNQDDSDNLAFKIVHKKNKTFRVSDEYQCKNIQHLGAKISSEEIKMSAVATNADVEGVKCTKIEDGAEYRVSKNATIEISLNDLTGVYKNLSYQWFYAAKTGEEFVEIQNSRIGNAIEIPEDKPHAIKIFAEDGDTNNIEPTGLYKVRVTNSYQGSIYTVDSQILTLLEDI